MLQSKILTPPDSKAKESSEIPSLRFSFLVLNQHDSLRSQIQKHASPCYHIPTYFQTSNLSRSHVLLTSSNFPIRKYFNFKNPHSSLTFTPFFHSISWTYISAAKKRSASNLTIFTMADENAPQNNPDLHNVEKNVTEIRPVVSNPNSVFPISLYKSWRSPSWMVRAYELEASGQTYNSSHDIMGSAFLIPLINWCIMKLNSWGARILASLQKREAFVSLMLEITRITFKAIICWLMVSLIRFSWSSYGSLNRNLNTLANNATQSAMHRKIQIGRFRRLTLRGVSFDSIALEASAKDSTAPDFSTDSFDIEFRGALNAVFKKTPIKIYGVLRNPVISAKQKKVTHKKYAWDHGLVLHSESRSPSDRKEINKPRFQSVPSFEIFGRSIYPGGLEIKNSFVKITPAGLADYGYGRQVQKVRQLNGIINIDHTKQLNEMGVVSIIAKGVTDGDGDVNARVSLRIPDGSNSNDSKGHQESGDVAEARFFGSDIPGKAIAALLNLPFKADTGKCSGDLTLRIDPKADFPNIMGEAYMDDVSLVFSADPDAPTMNGVKGRVRFLEKTVFFEGPSGNLGEVPITVVGSIDLQGEYNLTSSIRRTDVNMLLDSFKVKKFVFTKGLVGAEVRMHGILEEPQITGSLYTETPAVFDKMPIEEANAKFNWKATTGSVIFDEINAKIEGQGTIAGKGGLYFDLNKYPTSNPNQLRRRQERADIARALPPEPEDELDIDQHAKDRIYESMYFTFEAKNLNGGRMMEIYGGKMGIIAKYSLGEVEGEAIIAGHMKNAIAQAFWRTKGPAPALMINKTKGKESIVKDSFMEKLKKISPEEAETILVGGSKMDGIVNIMLGDEPENRRIRATGKVYEYDVKRAGWNDKELRSNLELIPVSNITGTYCFKGCLHNRLLLPSGITKLPRAIPMELLGASGILDVESLSINDALFEKPMTGTFSFSKDDLALDIQDHEDRDKIKVSASVVGYGRLSLRNNNSVLMADLSGTNELTLKAEDFAIGSFIGKSTGMSGEVNAVVESNLRRSKGHCVIDLKKPRYDRYEVEGLTSELHWFGDTIIAQKTVLKQSNSEYHMEALFRMNQGKPEWELKAIIPKADISEMVSLLTDKDTSERQESQDSNVFYKWKVPDELSFADQVKWFEATKDQRNLNDSTVALRKMTKQPLPDIRDLSGNFHGTLSLKVGKASSSGESPLKAIQAVFDLDGENWRLGSHDFGKIRARGSVKDGVLVFDPIFINESVAGGFEFNAQGQLGYAGKIGGKMSVRNIRASTILQYTDFPLDLVGRVNCSLEFDGTVTKPIFKVVASVNDGALNSKELQMAKGSFLYEDNRLRLRLNANIGNRFEIGDEKKRRKEDTQKLSKTSPMLLEVSVPFKLDVLERLFPPDVEETATVVDDSVKIDFAIENNAFEVLNLISQDIQLMSGSSDLDFHMRGTFEKPKVNGSFKIANGKLFYNQMAEPLSNIKGKIFIEEGSDQLNVKSLTATMKGKLISLKGTIPLHSESSEEKVEQPLTLKLDNVPLDIGDAIVCKAFAEMKLKGSLEKPVVAGKVRFSNGLLLVNNVTATTEASKSKEGDNNNGSSTLSLDNLEIELGKDVKIVYPFVLNFAANGKIIMDGPVTDPSLEGRINLSRGELNVMTSRMTLKRGSQNFVVFTKDGGLDPVVNVTLEDDFSLVQIRDVKASEWKNRIEMKRKEDGRLAMAHSDETEEWTAMFENRLAEVNKNLGLQLAAKALIYSYGFQGNVGETEWRCFPLYLDDSDGLVDWKNVGMGYEISYQKISVELKHTLLWLDGINFIYSPSRSLDLIIGKGREEAPTIGFRLKWAHFE